MGRGGIAGDAVAAWTARVPAMIMVAGMIVLTLALLIYIICALFSNRMWPLLRDEDESA